MPDRPFVHALISVLALLALAGCASNGDVDPRELQLAEAAIDDAKQLDAQRFAPEVLREAQQRLGQARERVDEGRAQEALRLLHEARVLALRAEAESLAAQTADAVEVVQQSLAAMEQTLGLGARPAAAEPARR